MVIDLDNKNKIKKPELLIPAGSLEVLKVAVDYGADAVYIGGQKFGLRAKAGNFSIDEMKQAADYAHAAGTKLYVTVNIFAHNDDIEGIKKYFTEISFFFNLLPITLSFFYFLRNAKTYTQVLCTY